MRAVIKIVFGAASCGPIVFFGFFFFWLLPAFFRRTPIANHPTLFEQRFHALIPFAVATSVLLVVLLLIYASLLARRPDLQIVEKIGIPALILLTNGIVLPAIFWWYIWRHSNLETLRSEVLP